MENALVVILALASAMIFDPSERIQNTEDMTVRSSFNSDWRFARYGTMPDGTVKEEPVGVERAELDDSHWRTVHAPHDWGIEGPFRNDLPGNTGKLPWTGIGWYRKHFNVSTDDKEKRFFIDFDGAMSHAKVWLNGEFLGQWPYGYASFRLELTPHLHFDRENILALRLDNPPNSSRWYPGGGLYRNVWIVKTGPVHVAHRGSFVTTSSAGQGKSAVHIRTEIENQSSDPIQIDIRVDIREAGNQTVVASAPECRVRIPAGGTGTCGADVILNSPKLWSLKSPILYNATTTLRANSRQIDAVETLFGVREVEFTQDRGFLLNGTRVRINGVCNHHDLGLLGTAVNEKALERQIRLLQEMGCNAIRTSHNPPAPELLDLCDRMGMLVLDEAFDCWVTGKTPNDYSTLFKEWHEKDIRAFVRRDRNHPCVIAWSSGNEIREQDDGVLAATLREIFRSEDSTRVVTAGCDNPKAGFNGFQNSVDVFGYNYKPHLYGKFHETHPLKPLWGTETASCVSTFGEYVFPVSDDKSMGLSKFQMSSYDLYAPAWATIPDVEFEAQDRNPFVAGEFVWTGFDYLGEPTPFADSTSPSRSSYFGIFDLCGFKKDRFYLYQSRWRPDLPMAHILPHWNWEDRIGKITPVHVYTSGDEAELFLNGQSLGRKKKQPFEYRLRWDEVRYAPGELNVIAYKEGREWASDAVTTTGPAVKLELTTENNLINADGHDLAFVNVVVEDRNGRRVPKASSLIRFNLTGPAALAAVGNGDPTSLEPFQSVQVKAFHGQCLVIVRSIERMPGAIRLTAESEGLTSGILTLSAK